MTKTKLAIPSVADMVVVFDEIDRAKAVHAVVYATGRTATGICVICGDAFRYRDGCRRVICMDCTTEDIFKGKP